MYWSILDDVVERTGTRWQSTWSLHQVLKVRCNCIQTVQLLDGRRVLIPGSVSRMSAADANAFYNKAIAVICEEILHISVDELLAREAA